MARLQCGRRVSSGGRKIRCRRVRGEEGAAAPSLWARVHDSLPHFSEEWAVSFGKRRQTVRAWVGGVPIGSGHPVVVQSMTNTDTADAAGTAEQVAALARAGSQLVRVTVNNDEAAAAVPEIVRRLGDLGVEVPVVGDFHY